MRVRNGTITSPKPAVVAGLRVGSILAVRTRPAGPTTALVVEDAAGQLAGSLTFYGYLDVIDCIQNQGVAYRAVVTNIVGGAHEVRVEPV